MSKFKTATQISKLLISFFVLFIIHYSLFINPVYAKDCDPNIPGDCPAGLEQIEGTFSNFISISVGLAFVAVLVMAVLAGFKYLTSGGEPKAVQSAHSTLTWALLGIFLMAVAWLVLQLVQALTGVDVVHFNIKTLVK